jgi:hypothetical protein
MNQPANGNINSLFENFSTSINKRIVETAAKESEDRVFINPQNRERLWQYASTVKCQ